MDELMADDDLLAEGKAAFDDSKEAEDHNRITALESINFALLEEQWPSKIRDAREKEDRPCLTINRMKAFIRQVVNDARQNKPSIKVHPVDSGADPKTAKIIDGLIRNIEYTSSADIAYDTAVECAVAGGFGYFRIGMDYAYDDAFDMDLTIKRVANPFSVYGDPHSTAADSSDWNSAFVVDRMRKSVFEREYKGKALVDFNADAWSGVDDTWMNDDGVLVAEWWKRDQVEEEIALLEDGRIVSLKQIKEDEDIQLALQTGLTAIKGTRKAKRHKVTQRFMTGAEIIKTVEWPGCYIPIVPVYGDEFNVEGKRYLRSLIYSAIDSQRMFNFWRTASTELVALAPRVPFIGEEGAFDVDPNWQTVNTASHPFLEFAKNKQPPMRQPMDMGVAAGALQEALNASDDMKSIMGLYDASLGARSNETSGRAIMARQREGDVSTFHFVDNMSRAIRHAGRILIDLIPKVYSTPRIVRVIGEDGTQTPAVVNQPAPETDKEGKPVVDEMGQAVMAMHDLTAGKYDLTVTSGPSFTTRREEAAFQMMELVRAFPAVAPAIGDILAKNLDWPGADEIAERLKAMNPASQQDQIPPELQEAIQQGQQMIQQLQQENDALKADKAIEAAKVEETRRANMADEDIDGFNAETNRMKAVRDAQAKMIQAQRPAPQPASAR